MHRIRTLRSSRTPVNANLAAPAALAHTIALSERSYALLRMHARDGETMCDVVERLCDNHVDLRSGRWTWSPRTPDEEILALPM